MPKIILITLAKIFVTCWRSKSEIINVCKGGVVNPPPIDPSPINAHDIFKKLINCTYFSFCLLQCFWIMSSLDQFYHLLKWKNINIYWDHSQNHKIRSWKNISLMQQQNLIPVKSLWRSWPWKLIPLKSPIKPNHGMSEN